MKSKFPYNIYSCGGGGGGGGGGGSCDPRGSPSEPLLSEVASVIEEHICIQHGNARYNPNMQSFDGMMGYEPIQQVNHMLTIKNSRIPWECISS